MVEEEHPKYSTMSQPWWANDMLIMVLSLVSIGIIVFDYETGLSLAIGGFRLPESGLEHDLIMWWILALIDLILILFFTADLIEDYSRCNDKHWWWTHNGWEFLGLVPMIVTGLPFLSKIALLRLLRLVRAFAAIMRLLGVSRRAERGLTVQKQVMHLFVIVGTLLLAGGFMTYVFEKEYYERSCETDIGCDEDVTIDSLGDSIWWAVVTGTTVGYGDYSPISIGGKVIASALMLVGIGMVGTLAATLSQWLYGESANMGPLEEGPLDGLERLSLLHEMGQLDDEEFKLGKKMLLARLANSPTSQSDERTRYLPMSMQVASKMKAISSMDNIEEE